MEEEETELVYIVLPENLGPIDRGDKYEDPIDDALQAAELGYVSGGGSSLGDEQPDGMRQIEFCGIDVEAFDLDKTLEFLRGQLPGMGCLAGTQLQYRKDDAALQDEFNGASWALGQPRTMMHPGFGI